MARQKLKFAWIADRKARKAACQQRMQALVKKTKELTILCDTRASLIFYSRDDGKRVVWPSQEEAESLMERYKAFPHNQKNTKVEDQESYINTNTKKIKKKLDHSQKVVTELEMEHLMLQLQNNCSIDDLSLAETDNLMSYLSNKMAGIRRELVRNHPYTTVNEPLLRDEIPKPKALDVALGMGPCFRPMGRGSVYLMDTWVFDDPKVQKHGDETHMASRFNVNMESSYDDDDMEKYEGESSKSGGADDA